jgi:hypothetical protein
LKKSKPVKKSSAKPAKAKAKALPKKAKPSQKVAPKLKKPAKAAKAVKPAKSKAPVKAAKPAAKKVAAKAPAKKAVKPAKPVKAATKAPAKKAAAPAPKAKAPVGAKPVSPVKEAPKPVKAAPVVKEVAAPVVKPAKVKGEKLSKAEKAAAAAAPAEAFPALDPSVKRPAKPFFLEVKPGVERVIKRGDKSAASPVLDIQARRKGPAAEESSEELAERIERELQSQSFLKRNRMRPQLCTKCGINAVAPRFTIDRELGYCDPCAEILHLGETKEARRMEFNLALKKDDPEAEAAPIEGPPADLEDEPLPDDLVD